MPAVSVLSAAVRGWANAALLLESPESEIVEWSRNVRNWRRYNRTVTVGPADERGCKRVTIEWDEDYEYEVVIVVESKPSWGLGYNWGGSGGFSLGGRRTYRIGWFEVKGEHHRESSIECPGDSALASAGGDGPTSVSVGGEEIWCGEESPLVAVVTGGTVAPLLDGSGGHLEAFIDWMSDRAAKA